MLQLRRGLRPRGEAKECNEGIHGDAESVAQRAQEESLSHQGRENYAGHYNQDDAHSGVNVVRQRA